MRERSDGCGSKYIGVTEDGGEVRVCVCVCVCVCVLGVRKHPLR